MKKIIVFLFTIILLIIAVFGIYFVCKISFKHHFEGEKEFVVESGQTVQEIGQSLIDQDIIKSEFMFKLYLYLKGQQTDVQAGTYNLESMNIIELTKKFVSGQTGNEVTLKFIEGWTLKEMSDYLSEQKLTNCLVCGSTSFLNLTKVGNFKSVYSFLDDVSEESLEGFIFPDTYRVYRDSSTSDIIQKALDNFEDKLTSALQTEITAQGKELYNIIKVASIIEMEVPNEEDRKIVSGILWKRLDDDMLLQVDSSLKYVIGKKDRNALTFKELETDSPYNTYKYKGLPPTPISNPGESAIRAAIYPKDSNYWYYLSTDEGETIFSETGEEHEANVEKYLK